MQEYDSFCVGGSRLLRYCSKIVVVVLLLLAWPVLAISSEALAGGLKIGDEMVVASDGPGGKLRSLPAVAYGDGIYLVVWQEGWHGDQGNSRIYAARVGLDGKVLDPGGVEVAPCKTGVQENPRVAFIDGVFLVVWQDLRNGEDCDVLGARFSLEGKVLDSASIPIGIGPRTQAMPDVAADDEGFLVVWHGFQHRETAAKIFAACIGRDGPPAKAVVIVSGATPRIAWNGKEHLLVFSTVHPYGVGAEQRKRWLRLDMTAKPQSKPGIMWGNSYYSVAAISEEKGWLMVCPGGPPNFWGRTLGIQQVFRITPEGKLAADSPSLSRYVPKDAKDVTNWLDTSLGKKGLWPWGGSAVAKAGTYNVVVWQRYKIGGSAGIALSNGDIRAGRVDGCKNLDKLGGVAVSPSPADELNPELAGDNEGRLLCVYEKRLEDGARQICARTIETK